MIKTPRVPAAVAAGTLALLGALHAPQLLPAADTPETPAEVTRTVTTWAASDDMAGGSMNNITVRNLIHTSVGGKDLRIRVSNGKGTQPLTFDSVYVGQQADGAALVPGTNRRLTFGGETTVEIPPGATALSDPLPGPVPAGQNLAVSLHVVGDSGPITAHNRTMQFTYKSTSGDHADDVTGTPYGTQSAVWFFLDAVLVEAPPQTGTVATLGDSITSGVGTTTNANRRWPDVVADRFAQLPAHRQLGIANEGISGNRVLSGVSKPGSAGDSGLARLERDVLAKPGVDTVLLFEGVNDIGAGSSATEIIAGYRQLIARTKASGRCIVAATIIPFGGSVYGDEESEVTRQQVNTFIRTSGEFDAWTDFDAAVRDAADPASLRADFHNGDGLHPNDAGNAAMAGAVNLDDLRCARR